MTAIAAVTKSERAVKRRCRYPDSGMITETTSR